jgi:hypothetical protein
MLAWAFVRPASDLPSGARTWLRGHDPGDSLAAVRHAAGGQHHPAAMSSQLPVVSNPRPLVAPVTMKARPD